MEEGIELTPKNEEQVKAILEGEQLIRRHGDWLFCQLRPPSSKRDINQWRHVAICKKIECKYLTEEGKPDCHCPTSLQYLAALRNISKDELIHARKERKADRRLDKDDDEDTLQNSE